MAIVQNTSFADMLNDSSNYWIFLQFLAYIHINLQNAFLTNCRIIISLILTYSDLTNNRMHRLFLSHFSDFKIVTEFLQNDCKALPNSTIFHGWRFSTSLKLPNLGVGLNRDLGFVQSTTRLIVGQKKTHGWN